MRSKHKPYLYALVIIASLMIIGLTLYLLVGDSWVPEVKISGAVLRIRHITTLAKSPWSM